jgi:hypothetical protein
MTLKPGKISFVSGLPQGYSCAFPPNLYNLPDHLALLPLDGAKSFYVMDRLNQIKGLAHFLIDKEKAVSLPQRPFGSFEFCESIGFNIINSFVTWVIAQLKESGIKWIEIKTCSPIYAPYHFYKTLFSLTSHGFEVKGSDINHHIRITSTPFVSNIHRQERKRFNKCRRERFIFQVEPVSRLEEVYGFLIGCRKEKGQPISVAMEQLSLSFRVFPDRYCLFSVRKDGNLAAASVAVKVNEYVIYDFMHASPMEFNNYSPVVFLIEGIYKYAQQNQFKYIDLGISSIDNKPQVSLIRFKENIGGVATVKLRLTKTG